MIGWLHLCLYLLLAVCGIAPSPLHAASPESYYLTPSQLPPQLLPPPPVEGSGAWQKNIQGVLMAQKHISTGDLTALRDEQHSRLTLMTDVLGSDFTREKFPHIFTLLDRVFADSEAIVGADKQYWHTRRPYLTDTRVKLLVDRIDQNPAYPSGHTSGSRVLAEVLGMLYPDHLADLRIRADAIAFHRVEAGVHYPVDLEGGRLLAMLIIGALTQNEAFQSDLADARQEASRHNQ